MSRHRHKRKKSKQWLKRHTSDAYVKQAQQSGYRARAAYKLGQIDQRYNLIQPATRLLDLGAAPGSWCQYAAEKTGEKGLVVAVDLLAMQPITHVQIVQGDFCDPDVQARILHCINGTPVDLILSDMAPDITGIRITDQANMERLLSKLIDSLKIFLKPGGNVLIKVFQGELLSDLSSSLNSLFNKVINIKPEASRKHSREMYLLAMHYQGE